MAVPLNLLDGSGKTPLFFFQIRRYIYFIHAGGLTAVIWTDFIQTVIMMIGATALMIIGETPYA